MYIRLKRKNQTVFLHIDPADNFSQIKQRIATIFHLEPTAIMLLASDKVKSLFLLNNYDFDEHGILCAEKRIARSGDSV